MGGWGERKRESSQSVWDGNHFKDTGPHRRSVPRCVRGVWKAEMAAVWVPAKATSGRNVRKIKFFTQQSQGGEWKTGEIRKKMRNLGAALKKKDRWMAEQNGANYFTALVGPEGFAGSEIHSKCSIRFNCAVAFYATVTGGILDKAWGTWHEQFLKW